MNERMIIIKVVTKIIIPKREDDVSPQPSHQTLVLPVRDIILTTITIKSPSLTKRKQTNSISNNPISIHT